MLVCVFGGVLVRYFGQFIGLVCFGFDSCCRWWITRRSASPRCTFQFNSPQLLWCSPQFSSATYLTWIQAAFSATPMSSTCYTATWTWCTTPSAWLSSTRFLPASRSRRWPSPTLLAVPWLRRLRFPSWLTKSWSLTCNRRTGILSTVIITLLRKRIMSMKFWCVGHFGLLWNARLSAEENNFGFIYAAHGWKTLEWVQCYLGAFLRNLPLLSVIFQCLFHNSLPIVDSRLPRVSLILVLERLYALSLTIKPTHVNLVLLRHMPLALEENCQLWQMFWFSIECSRSSNFRCHFVVNIGLLVIFSGLLFLKLPQRLLNNKTAAALKSFVLAAWMYL